MYNVYLSKLQLRVSRTAGFPEQEVSHLDVL